MTMSCEKIQAELDERLGENSENAQATLPPELAAHLQTCPACSEYWRENLDILQSMETLAQSQGPSELVIARLQKEARKKLERRQNSFFQKWIRPSSVAAAIFLVALGVSRYSHFNDEIPIQSASNLQAPAKTPSSFEENANKPEAPLKSIAVPLAKNDEDTSILHQETSKPETKLLSDPLVLSRNQGEITVAGLNRETKKSTGREQAPPSPILSNANPSGIFRGTGASGPSNEKPKAEMQTPMPSAPLQADQAEATPPPPPNAPPNLDGARDDSRIQAGASKVDFFNDQAPAKPKSAPVATESKVRGGLETSQSSGKDSKTLDKEASREKTLGEGATTPVDLNTQTSIEEEAKKGNWKSACERLKKLPAAKISKAEKKILKQCHKKGLIRNP